MIGCIIQARMGSSRLPGKMMKIVDGKFLLDYVIDQLKSSKKIEKIVVATTTLPIDNLICEHLSSKNITFFRGSSNDVLDAIEVLATDKHEFLTFPTSANHPETFAVWLPR
jgi:spore coat polysaccharide biosynthesis protein SpsF